MFVRYLTFLVGLCAATAAHAQVPAFPFQIRIQQGNNVGTLANNGTLTVGAERLGQPVPITVSLTHRGPAAVTFAQQPQIFGSTDFSSSLLDSLPLTLMPGSTLPIELRFTPTSSRTATAQFQLPYSEPGAPGSPATAGVITLNLVGTAPDFVISYVLQGEGNVISVPPGGTLTFPSTVINTTSVAGIAIVNRGSGTGTIESLNVTGDSFQLLGVPLLPFNVSPGENLTFSIRYNPRRIETSTGILRIGLGEQTITINLEGSAIGSAFAYEVLSEDGAMPLLPDQSFSVSETKVGQSSSVAIRIRNTGSTDRPVNSINLSPGSGFQLADVPFLPQTLAPNSALVFTLSFEPLQAGLAKARLRIGNDSFEVTGTGTGPRLIYSNSTALGSADVLPNGQIIFSPTQVGETIESRFTVRNEGNAFSTIANIGIVAPGNGFRLSELPNLPVVLGPNESVTFSIGFRPQTTGFLSATLRADAVAFSLTGSGSAPTALPDYALEGISGTVGPLEQPAVKLTLSSTYPLPLAGLLTLSVNPEAFAADPAVQFATGGRTVTFSIPANSQEAIFPNGSNQIRMQTGSVAGTFTITPSFATSSGLNLTPESPQTLQFSMAASEPQLLTAQVGARTASGFSLFITGVSTSRTLRQMDFQFTPNPDFSVPTTQINLNIESEAGAWFRSTQSEAFGGQFVVAIPFNLQSDDAAASLLAAIQSVSVTATNQQGASNAMTIDLR